jgi:hypothetical protein
MPCPCRFLPCRGALIHICQGVLLPCRAPAVPLFAVPCRSPAVSLPFPAVPLLCRAALIHTRHTAPQPFSDSAVSVVKVRVVAGNTQPLVCFCNNFHGTPRGSRKKPKAGRSPICRIRTDDSNSHMPCHTHATPMPRCDVTFRDLFRNYMVLAWQGNRIKCVNQTRSHCVNEMGETQSKPLAEKHGNGMAGERHGMCELALILLRV